MLIVITRDQIVMDWVLDERSGAEEWGAIKFLSCASQEEATAQLIQLLKLVKSDEPLCITGHGNDFAIGGAGSDDDDWPWSYAEFAAILPSLVDGYGGPILLEVCAESVTSFAANMAVEAVRYGSLYGAWVFSYQKSISAIHEFPHPYKMTSNIKLYGTQFR